MKAARLLFALFLVVSLAACNVGGADKLTGTWQKENGKDTITFSPGGKVQLASGAATIGTGYKLTGADTLQFDLGILGTGALKYSLSPEGLTITDANGKASKFIREKETK